MKVRASIGRTFLWLLMGCSLSSCASTRSPYERATQTASDAYSAGRYAEARRHYLVAADEADSARDRDEARYRAAAALDRMGRRQEAARELLTLWKDNPGGERAARALSDAASEATRRGDVERAQALHLRVVREYPQSGLAVPNVRRYLALVAKSDEERVEAIERLLESPPSPGLAEALRWERGLALERANRLEEALEAYDALAQKHPYPYGAYWDDAMMHGAAISRRLGRPRESLERLDALLVERESAVISGSYQRSAFAEAQFLRAEILRDDLSDPERARREFRRVFSDHPTSLLRDDALWEEARISSASEACAPLRLLVRELPESRYAPCAELLCGDVKPPDARECRHYIRRGLDESTNSASTTGTTPPED